jgi:hypothetical protein
MKLNFFGTFALLSIASVTYCKGSMELVNVQEVKMDDIKAVEISYHSEKVSLFKGATEDFVIKEYRNRKDSKFNAKITNAGNKLSIERGRWLSFRLFYVVRSRVEIYIPASYTHKISIKTTSGKIETIGEYTVSEMNLESTSGKIHCENVNGNTAVHTTSGGIDIGTINGNVTAEASSGQISANRIAGDFTSKSTSGSIHCENVNGNTAVHTTSGSIDIGTINGNVTAEASSGQISANQITGDFTSKSTSGSIHCKKADGTLSASTTSGNITFDIIDGEISAKSTSGRIKLNLVNGGVNAKNLSGGIYCTIGKNIGDITIATTSGSVGVYLPKDSGFNFSSRTSSGALSTPFEEELFSPVTDKNLVKGVINGDNISINNPHVNIKTISGSIAVNWTN